MSTTIQSLVDQVSYDLLETPVSGGGPGLTSGLVTQQEVLDLLGNIILDFCRQTGLTWDVYTQRMLSGTSAYTVPDRMTTVYYVFQNARIVDKVDLFSNYFLGQWRQKTGQTKAYHEDGLPVKTLEVIPVPNITGSATAGVYGSFQPGNRNLSFVGNMLPSKEVWSIGDTLDGIPDSFTPYLVFGVLERIFTKDGEARDLQRALYCGARYREGVSLARAILLQLSEESQAEAQ